MKKYQISDRPSILGTFLRSIYIFSIAFAFPKNTLIFIYFAVVAIICFLGETAIKKNPN